MNLPRTIHPLQMQLPIDTPESPSIGEGSPRLRLSWLDHQDINPVVALDDQIVEQGMAVELRRASLRPLQIRQPATTRQQGFLRALARESGLSAEELDRVVLRRFGAATVSGLERRQAAEMIRVLQDQTALPVAS